VFVKLTLLFTAVTLLMGRIGAVAVAAHQVALNYAALMFMIPLGLSMGMTIRVGQIIGAEMPERARLAGVVGMAMAVSVMVLSALVMVVVPERIAAMYTSDPEVAALAVELLMFAALFQVSDGLQVSAVGALRGLKDTARPMLITFIAYWLLGLPLAWALGLQGGLGPPGLWVGLVVGLTVAAVLLTWRFHRLSAYRIRHGAGPQSPARSPR